MNGNGDVESDLVDSLHLTDRWIASITSERISAALADFALPFVEGWDIARLTRAIQDKANLSRERRSTGPLRQSNSEARLELSRLSNLGKKLLEGIEGLASTSETAAFWSAFGYFESHDEISAESPPLFTRIKLVRSRPLEHGNAWGSELAKSLGYLINDRIFSSASRHWGQHPKCRHSSRFLALAWSLPFKL
jgi:hypothetical protein